MTDLLTNIIATDSPVINGASDLLVKDIARDSAVKQVEPMNRRSFLKQSSGLASMITVAPGFMLLSPANAATNTATGVRWGMLIDTSKCTQGCTHCVDACNAENHLTEHHGAKTDSQWIRKVELKDKDTGHETSLPVMCQHCEKPPCVDVCPTGASFKRDDGIVLVDKHTCIGCRYCIIACPYKARNFVHEDIENQNPDVPRGKSTAEGCTLCVHRIDKGKNPACADACSAAGLGAILFGDIKDSESEIHKRLQQVASQTIRADLGLSPAIHYMEI